MINFQRTLNKTAIALGLMLGLVAAPAALGQGFDIDWSTVDGGGDMWTIGGDYELSGTIGQHDAGTTMTGGGYSLSGGFWFAPGGSGPQLYPGDMDCDGDVDFDDIDPFVLALGGQAGYEAQFPDCIWLNADCDENGGVDFDDIDAFVALIGTDSL